MENNLKFLEDLHKAINKAGRAYIVYTGELRIIRGTSTAVNRIRQEHLVGVYTSRSTDHDIISDCLYCIEIYDKKVLEQAKLLDERMG